MEPESIRAVLQVQIPAGLVAVHDRWPTPDVLNAVLMCRHPRLGASSPPAMRDLPDGIWCCVFFFVHSISEPAMLVGMPSSGGFTYAERCHGDPPVGLRVRCSFDRILGPQSTAQQLFGSVQPIVAQVLQGRDGTVFAYGSSNCGVQELMQSRANGVMVSAIRHLLELGTDSFQFSVSCVR